MATIHLHLLCAAATPSHRDVGFPADEPLDPAGRESLSRLSGRLPAFDALWRSPALCAAQTAAGLGLKAVAQAPLVDCDFGRWTGHSLKEIAAQEPDTLAKWIKDTHAAPHGGESFADVCARVGDWMGQLLPQSGRVLAITHPTILRAAIACALGAGPDAFRHIDVAPLTRVKLSGGGGRWTLQTLIPLKDTIR